MANRSRPRPGSPASAAHSPTSAVSGLVPRNAKRRPASLLLAAAIGLAGCATPGGVRPSREQVPVAVQDLRTRQAGPAIVLQFTLPRHAVDGTSLEGAWSVRIYRRFLAAAGGPSRPVAELAGPPVYSLDADALANYLSGNAVTYPDSLSPEEFEAYRGEQVLYQVRVGVDGGSWSGQSNLAAITLATPPSPVTGLSASIAPAGVTLRWTPPGPGSAPAPAAYIVYRAKIKPAGAGSPASPSRVGLTAEPTYLDTDIQPGAAYRYTVRSLAREAAGEVESADSSPLIVRALEQLSPAPPTGVVAIAVRSAAGSLEVDASWAIPGEAGVAGYNIYRSERPGQRGARLNRQLVATTAFRDRTVVPGRTYSYSVTAVDLAGNESAASAPAVVSPATPDAAPRRTRLRPRVETESGRRAAGSGLFGRDSSRKAEGARCAIEILPVSPARFRRRNNSLGNRRG